jgi:hypothetical protein
MVKKFTKKALDNYKKIVVSELKRKLNKPGSDLEKSITARKIRNIDGFTVSMNYYGTFVNSGRRAGAKSPARGTIEEWISKKGIQPKKLSDGRTPTLKQLAFLIRRSIVNNGIQPVRFFDVLDDIEPKLTKDIESAYLKDLELELDKKIPKNNK